MFPIFAFQSLDTLPSCINFNFNFLKNNHNLQEIKIEKFILLHRHNWQACMKCQTLLQNLQYCFAPKRTGNKVDICSVQKKIVYNYFVYNTVASFLIPWIHYINTSKGLCYLKIHLSCKNPDLEVEVGKTA